MRLMSASPSRLRVLAIDTTVADAGKSAEELSAVDNRRVVALLWDDPFG